MSDGTKISPCCPLSEGQIRAVTVGELKPLSGLIQIVEYVAEWPRTFELEAEKIRVALDDRMLQVEHIGSTAVPGLSAKPIIDMLLVVEDSANEAAYVPALIEAGYVLRIREPEFFEHRMLKGGCPDVNLHVFGTGCPEIERHLIFRDRLRENESDRDLYATVKRDLAKRNWRYGQNYADAKTEVIAQIMLRARPSGVQHPDSLLG